MQANPYAQLAHALDPVKFAEANRAHQHGAFRQIVARGDKKSSFGDRSAPVTGPSYPLQSNRNRTRRTDVAD